MCRYQCVDGPGLGWILHCAEFEAYEVEHVFGVRQPAHSAAIQQIAGERGHAVRFEPFPSAGVCKPANGPDLELVAGLLRSAAGQNGKRWPHLATRAQNHEGAVQLSNKLHQLRPGTRQQFVEFVFRANRLRQRRRHVSTFLMICHQPTPG